MKKIIIILGTIILGVIIVNSMILADTGLKGSATSIVTNCKEQVKLIDLYTK